MAIATTHPGISGNKRYDQDPPYSTLPEVQSTQPSLSLIVGALAAVALAPSPKRIINEPPYYQASLFEPAETTSTSAIPKHELTRDQWLAFLRKQYQLCADQRAVICHSKSTRTQQKRETLHRAERAVDYLIADYLGINRDIVDNGRNREPMSHSDNDGWLRIISMRSWLSTDYQAHKNKPNERAAPPRNSDKQKQSLPEPSSDARLRAAGDDVRSLRTDYD